MHIDTVLLGQYGGREALGMQVAAHAAAIEAHRLTVGEPAPVADPVVDFIARNGGMDALEVLDPPAASPAAPRTVSALEFRRRFTLAERAAITLAASRGLERGEATLQLWLDDLTAALAVPLDGAELAEGLAGLVKAGLIEPARVAELLA